MWHVANTWQILTLSQELPAAPDLHLGSWHRELLKSPLRWASPPGTSYPEPGSHGWASGAWGNRRLLAGLFSKSSVSSPTPGSLATASRHVGGLTNIWFFRLAWIISVSNCTWSCPSQGWQSANCQLTMVGFWNGPGMVWGRPVSWLLPPAPYPTDRQPWLDLVPLALASCSGVVGSDPCHPCWGGDQIPLCH